MSRVLPPLRFTRTFVVVAATAVAVSAVTAGSGARGVVDAAGVLVVYVGALLVHEGAHARAARAAGLSVDGITLGGFGGVTRYSGLDPGSRVLRRIALAGPKASFAAAVVSAVIAAGASVAGWGNGVGALAAWSTQINFVLAAVNMLPFGTLDGASARRAARQTGRSA